MCAQETGPSEEKVIADVKALVPEQHRADYLGAARYFAVHGWPLPLSMGKLVGNYIDADYMLFKRVSLLVNNPNEFLAKVRKPDEVIEIACPRCGGYPYSRPSCVLCKGTGKAKRNVGQPVGEYKGKNLYLLGASYNCPALNLYGYRNDLELKRAVGRKLGVLKRKENRPRLSR